MKRLRGAEANLYYTPANHTRNMYVDQEYYIYVCVRAWLFYWLSWLQVGCVDNKGVSFLLPKEKAQLVKLDLISEEEGKSIIWLDYQSHQ